MTEIFLGVFLLLFVLFQFIRKRGNLQTKEVVVYDSRTIAGKLSSLGVRAQVSLLIGGVLLIAIAVFSYLSFHNYSEIKELIANEQYLEAESRIESGPSVLPLFDIDELEYDLRLKWASASIDAEEWEQAVIQIRELKKDSIPQDLIPSAFESYYGYINSQIPYKDKKKFDECSSWRSPKDGFNTFSLYSYNEYLTLFNIDSALVGEAYELFDQLQEIKTLESYKTLVRVTHNYRNINLYLTQTNDTNFVAEEYVKNPEIIVNLDCKDTSILLERYMEAYDSREILEISLIKYCLNNNLISLEFITRASDYAFDVNFTDAAERWKRPILKTVVEKAYLDLLTNYRWGEENFDLETRFLMGYMDMVYFDEPSSVRGDRLAIQLKRFLSVYSKNILNALKDKTHKTREKIGATLIWENNWAISYSEFDDLNFDSFGGIREYCLLIGDYFSRDKRGYDALYWYDLGLGMNELYPYHNSPVPLRSGPPEAYHLYESSWYYYKRAITKWNIKPYGAKLGYCDDLQNSMELGQDCLEQYVNDCN